MLKILFIRHGQSVGNVEQRMAGHSDDRLTPTGQLQCRQLGHWLYQQGWQPSHIYSSPLPRAVESIALLSEPWPWQYAAKQSLSTATTLNFTPQQPQSVAIETSPPVLQFDLRLQEFDAGILTGLTWQEAQKQFPELCQTLESSWDWVPIPQAETPDAGRDRAAQFVEHVLGNHHHQEAIWVMSHQWIMEHLIACLIGSDRTWQIEILNTALFEFWVDGDRWADLGINRRISNFWQIKRFGDRPHLP